MSIFGKIMDAIFGKAKAEGGGTPGLTRRSAGGGMSQVDVEKVVSDMAAQKKEKLDWRRSIVDLMKVLDLDSSLKARQALAKELNYTGDMNDSAKMNIWLHKQVMNKLAANGGKVPADLQDDRPGKVGTGFPSGRATNLERDDNSSKSHPALGFLFAVPHEGTKVNRAGLCRALFFEGRAFILGSLQPPRHA